jgi:hypothetical protein
VTRIASDAEVERGMRAPKVKAVADPLGLIAQPSIVYLSSWAPGPPEAERTVTWPILPYDNRSMARRSVSLASPCCKLGKPLPLTH